MDRLGARVVAGVVPRVQVHDAVVRDARPPQALLARTGGAHRQPHDADDRRALHSPETRAATRNRLGRDAPLPVGGPRERKDDLLTHDHVAHLDHVTHCVDRWVARAHPIVDGDPAPLAHDEAGRLRELPFGSHADGEDHQVGLDPAAGVGDDDEALALTLDPAHPLAEAKRDPARPQVLRDRHGHLGVERGHHLRQLLDDRHSQPAVHEVLGHLETDEAPADDDRLAARSVREPRANPARVGDRADHEDAGQVDPRRVGANRRRAGGEDEDVVGLLPALARRVGRARAESF